MVLRTISRLGALLVAVAVVGGCDATADSDDDATAEESSDVDAASPEQQEASCANASTSLCKVAAVAAAHADMTFSCKAFRGCRRACSSETKACAAAAKGAKRKCKDECKGKSGKDKRECKTQCAREKRDAKRACHDAKKTCTEHCSKDLREGACTTARNKFWLAVPAAGPRCSQALTESCDSPFPKQ